MFIMNKKGLFGHSIFLIILSISISAKFIVKTTSFKGMLIEGLSKYIFISFFLIFLFYNYIRAFFFKKYESYIEAKQIYFNYLISPLFFTWITMCVYLIIGDEIEYIDNFNQYVFIYSLLCLLLIYFQNRLLIKFEKMKNNKTVDLKNQD